MRYIKQFESSSNNVTATIVTIENGIDYVYALYLDEKLEFMGEYEVIEGFIQGLKWIKKEYVYPLNVIENNFKVTNVDIISSVCELGDSPPEYLKDLK